MAPPHCCTPTHRGLLQCKGGTPQCGKVPHPLDETLPKQRCRLHCCCAGGPWKEYPLLLKSNAHLSSKSRRTLDLMAHLIRVNMGTLGCGGKRELSTSHTQTHNTNSRSGENSLIGFAFCSERDVLCIATHWKTRHCKGKPPRKAGKI